MLSLDDRQELVAWMRDQLPMVQSGVKLAASLPTSQRHASDVDVPARLAYLACGHFLIKDEKDKATVAQSAKALASLPPEHQAAMIQTETFRFSREDLLDIAFWIERDDGYPASAVQVSAFLRSVVRGNLDELRKERVPPAPAKKLTIKRRKS